MRARTYGVNSGEWLDQHFDLRRRRQASLSDTLIRRAHWLTPEDCELVLAVFRDGRSAIAMAHMLDEDPRLIRRRIKRLACRLQDPRVAYVVAHQQHWSRRRRTIARRLFIMGQSMREITAELGVSLHIVRKHRDAIEAMCIESQSQKGASSEPTRQWRPTREQ